MSMETRFVENIVMLQRNVNRSFVVIMLLPVFVSTNIFQDILSYDFFGVGDI